MLYCKMFPDNYYKYFLKCLKCQKVICQKQKCKEAHSHQMIGFSHLKNLLIFDVICNIHSKKDYIAYCSICDKDLCESCILEEKLKKHKHNLIYYKDIFKIIIFLINLQM